MRATEIKIAETYTVHVLDILGGPRAETVVVVAKGVKTCSAGGYSMEHAADFVRDTYNLQAPVRVFHYSVKHNNGILAQREDGTFAVFSPKHLS